jgi:hypothetical protein
MRADNPALYRVTQKRFDFALSRKFSCLTQPALLRHKIAYEDSWLFPGGYCPANPGLHAAFDRTWFFI